MAALFPSTGENLWAKNAKKLLDNNAMQLKRFYLNVFNGVMNVCDGRN